MPILASPLCRERLGASRVLLMHEAGRLVGFVQFGLGRLPVTDRASPPLQGSVRRLSSMERLLMRSRGKRLGVFAGFTLNLASTGTHHWF